MPGKLTEQPVAGAGTEDDLYLVVQAVQSRKQTRTQLRVAILSAWQTFIRTFLASANEVAARSALGLAIGTNVQAQDADLQALADNAATGLLTRTGAGAVASRTITGTAGKVTVTQGNGVAGNPTLTLPDVLALVSPSVSGLLDIPGGQVKFPATQVPSADPNTLDDYEEGSWTMGLTFSTPGDLNVVYGAQTGRYTKAGRAFLYDGTVTTTTFTYTTATGTLRLTGLPIASGSGIPAVSLARWTGVVSAVATPQIVALVSSPNIQFEVMNVAAGTTATLNQANAASGVQKSIILSGQYATA